MSQTQQDPAQPSIVPAQQLSLADGQRAGRVAAAVRDWQRQLVGLGGRNTLLWYRDLPSGTLDLTTSHPGGMAMLLAGRPTRLSDLVREPTALEDARRRARTIRAKTLELYEERGLAVGYLAVGMATWQVPGASRNPCAPVLLRSCALLPTGADQQDFDIDLGRVELNPVLEHYLRSEQGIELDPLALEELATFTKGFDPNPVFADLRRLCQRVPSFQIAPRLVLGTFSLAKLPMVADLAAQAETLASHDVVAALAGDPAALRAVGRTIPDFAADPDPADEDLVLDADSSQLAVVEAVRSGVNLVVKGPPGTGKSQTIANLIVSLAGEGRTTLFVAEKRAAIETVTRRLQGLGLRDLVLDVRDGAASQRPLAGELGSVLDSARRAVDPDTAAIERTLTDRRTRLVEHCSALHHKRSPWGVSAFDAQVALTRLSASRTPPTSRVRIPGDTLSGISRARVDELSRSLTEAASLGAWMSGESDEDPWYGARVTSRDEASQALDIAGRLGGEGLDAAQQQLGAALREVGLPDAETPADWGRALNLVEQVRQTLDAFAVEVFDLPLTDLVAATATKQYREANGLRMGIWARMRLRRQARALLRPGPPPSDLHSALKVAQEQRTTWGELAGVGARPGVPGGIDDAEDTYHALASDLLWLGQRLATTVAGGDLLGTPLVDLQVRLAALAKRGERCVVLPRVASLMDDLRTSGLGALVDDLAARGVDAIDAGPELDLVWWTSLLDEVAVHDSAYGTHDGDILGWVGAEYIEADNAHLSVNVDRVRAVVGRRLREVVSSHPEQEALVRAQADGSQRHLPLRDLLPSAAETLTAIKPCWAMSPLAVASVLPIGCWFDVVIFDEASQIPPSHAVSAISRAAQVVVVGDDRQLPPTSFVTAAVNIDGLALGSAGEVPVVDTGSAGEVSARQIPPDGDFLTAGEMMPAAETGMPADGLLTGGESILDVLSTAFPVRRLVWHYRSLDERLVSFANTQMYGGGLLTFPGTSDDAPLRLEIVDGSAPVQPGPDAIESTPTEVDRVVRLVLSHARTRPNESLGVIALGGRHASLIDDALRVALAGADGVGDFFQGDRSERFFVKDLERVQGDVRDAVILSIGYGKTPHGRMLHRFGSLSLEGGERRLNVAITRARARMTVVSSFAAADLDPTRLRARGALMLRDFLAYAADGGAQPAGPPLAEPDVRGTGGGAVRAQPARPPMDRLLADLAARLRSEGLVVHVDYGSSARPLDLAVEDPHRPGQVLVVVESDGLRYAAMTSTRDRDRLRVEQLRRLGWEHVRVWSTDLFRDPERDVARVLAAVRAASSARPQFAVTGSRLEQTRDDTDAGWGERSDEESQDRWLQEQRPPHWG